MNNSASQLLNKFVKMVSIIFENSDHHQTSETLLSSQNLKYWKIFEIFGSSTCLTTVKFQGAVAISYDIWTFISCVSNIPSWIFSKYLSVNGNKNSFRILWISWQSMKYPALFDQLNNLIWFFDGFKNIGHETLGVMHQQYGTPTKHGPK